MHLVYEQIKNEYLKAIRWANSAYSDATEVTSVNCRIIFTFLEI